MTVCSKVDIFSYWIWMPLSWFILEYFLWSGVFYIFCIFTTTPVYFCIFDYHYAGFASSGCQCFFYFLLHFQPLCPVTDFYFCSILCWESCFWLILLVNWFFIVFVDFFRLPSISQTQGVTVIFSNQSVGLNFNLELSLF